MSTDTPSIPTLPPRSGWFRHEVADRDQWVWDLMPIKDPKGFEPLRSPRMLIGPGWWMSGNLKVHFSAEKIGEARWIHVSLSRPTRVPDYLDLVHVKRLFIGEYRPAVMVLPSKDKHVNDHPLCLHLFSPVEGELPLPDFRIGGTI